MYQRYQELLARGVSPAQMLYVSFEDERLSGITVQELNRLLEIKQEMTGGAPPYGTSFLTRFRMLTDGSTLRDG